MRDSSRRGSSEDRNPAQDAALGQGRASAGCSKPEDAGAAPGPRRPLVPPPTELERELLLLAEGLDKDGLPLNLTPAERLAAQDPGLPARTKESPMTPTKDGWKTTEFWLKVFIVIVVLPALMFFKGDGPMPSPLPDMADDASKLSPVLAVLAPVLLKAISAGLAWASLKLAEKYGDNRTSLKIAKVEAERAAA